MDNFVALAEINEAIYLDLAENGARILFDLYDYRVLDGVKNESANYFLIDFDADKYYLLDLATCYELVTMYHCGDSKGISVGKTR